MEYHEFKTNVMALDRRFRTAGWETDDEHNALRAKHKLEAAWPEHNIRLQHEQIEIRDSMHREVDNANRRDLKFQKVLQELSCLNLTCKKKKEIEKMVHDLCRRHGISYDAQTLIEREILTKNGH